MKAVGLDSAFSYLPSTLRMCSSSTTSLMKFIREGRKELTSEKGHGTLGRTASLPESRFMIPGGRL